MEIRQSITVSRPPGEVWTFFGDIAAVVPCLPGARLTRPPVGNQVEGQMSVKLGPITANFVGQARIERDEHRRARHHLGRGPRPDPADRVRREKPNIVVEAAEGGGTRVALTIRALLVGPLAQFGRGAIVEDLVARITEAFARNLEARLVGDVAADDLSTQRPFEAGSLVRHVIWARLKAMAGGLFGRREH